MPSQNSEDLNKTIKDVNNETTTSIHDILNDYYIKTYENDEELQYEFLRMNRQISYDTAIRNCLSQYFPQRIAMLEEEQKSEFNRALSKFLNDMRDNDPGLFTETVNLMLANQNPGHDGTVWDEIHQRIGQQVISQGFIEHIKTIGVDAAEIKNFESKFTLPKNTSTKFNDYKKQHQAILKNPSDAIQKQIKILQNEIDSWWPYLNKGLKKNKIKALEELAAKIKSGSTFTSALDQMKPDQRVILEKGTLSKRTAKLLKDLKKQSNSDKESPDDKSTNHRFSR